MNFYTVRYFSFFLCIVSGTSCTSSMEEYEGTYSGVLPCADCAGIKTTLILSDSTYYKKTTYLGENQDAPEVFEARGSLSWEPTQGIVTLGGIVPPNQYLVKENTLIQLDRRGRRITGAMAEKYELKK
jgi:uncharacterized lipoprotein NlpE involved in copper resistance